MLANVDWQAVVQAAAVALGTAAGTGVFNDARTGILALFRRGGRDEQETAQLLDDTDAAARGAEPDRRDDVRTEAAREWQVRMADLVRRNPELIDELLAWARETEGRLPATRPPLLQNVTAFAPGAVAQGVQHGNIINHHHPQPASGESATRSS